MGALNPNICVITINTSLFIHNPIDVDLRLKIIVIAVFIHNFTIIRISQIFQPFSKKIRAGVVVTFST